MELTSFVGRHADVQRLNALLAGGQLVTIVGPAGVGKTRLGLRLLEQRGGAVGFPDGAEVIDMLATPPQEPYTTDLVQRVAGKSMLVLLDSCDQQARDCAELVLRMRRAAPETCAIATSRCPLGVAGERQWRVRPLSSPTSAEDVERSEAVQLFVQRVAAQQPGFALTPETAPLVAQACHELDGLPLALELAAARIAVAGLESMRDRLADLTPDLDWKLSLLSPAEHELLTRLSVFAAGCTLEAAEFVCAGERLDPVKFLDSLQGLVRASLVLFDPTPAGGRYFLPNTLRRQLAPRADDALHDRVVLWCQQLADGLDTWSVDARQLEPLDRELGNLRAIFARAAEADGDDGRLRALNLCVACSPLWLIRHPRVGREWLPRLWGPHVLSLDPRLHARAAWLSAAFQLQADEPARALRELERAVQLLDEYADVPGALSARYYLAEAYLEHAQPEQALHVFNAVWQGARDHAHVLAPGVQARVAVTCLELGEVERAKAHVEESLRDARTSGHQWNLTRAWEATASLASRSGEPRAAVLGCEQALTFARLCSDPWAWVQPSLRLAEAYLETSERGRAAVVLRDVLGSPPGAETIPAAQTRRLIALAGRCVESTRPDQAERFQRAAARLWPSSGGADSVALARLRAEARLALEGLAKSPPPLLAPRVLSEREMAVAELLERGLTNRQIAHELTLSEGTVRVHVGHILDKLGLRSRVQVAARLREDRPVT